MKFLCLGYLDANAFDRIPQADRDEIISACMAQCVPFRATGKVIAEEGIGDNRCTQSICPENGRSVVTNGPINKGSLQLGSFFIIEAETMEEAIAVASLHPAARLGEQFSFGIEVHAIQ
jgi:hypothetical protein